MRLLSTPMGLFYALTAANLYASLEEPGRFANIAGALSDRTAACTIALWVVVDASRRGRPLPHIAGLYLSVLWVFLAPVYLFKTRGWRAFITMGAFLLICIAAEVASYIPDLLWTLRAD